VYTIYLYQVTYVKVISVFALDEIDRKLLRELLRDSKRSYRELAKSIGVSTATVINHIQRLESAGVITGYTVRLDHERLGPNVCAVYDITGLTDAMVVAKFKGRRSLSDFTKKLLAMPYIERTNTHVALTTMKEDFRMLQDM